MDGTDGCQGESHTGLVVGDAVELCQQNNRALYLLNLHLTTQANANMPICTVVGKVGGSSNLSTT